MLMPILPKYAISLGVDERLIGLINGFYTIASVSVRPLIGMECDRRGRKVVFMFGLSALFLSAIGYYWALSFIVILIWRIIHGMGWAACSTASNTIAADLIPAERKGEGIGYFGMFATIAQCAAPAVALSILANYGFKKVFIASILLGFMALFSGSVLKLEAYDIKYPKNVRPAFFDRRAVKVSILMFFLAISYSGIVSYIALCGEERGISNMSPFFLAYAVGILSSRLRVGKYYDKKGPKLIIILSYLALFISDIILANASTILLFSLGGIIFGAGYGALHPTLLAMSVKDIELERRGAVNGTVMSAFDLGVAIGSMFLGIVASYGGYVSVYMTAALAPLVGLFVYLRWKRYEMIQENY